MTQKALIQVVGACFVRGQKILMFRKKQELSNGGLFEFPGGKILPGETPKQALARELKEELGVQQVQVQELIAMSQLSTDQQEIQLAVYRCELFSERFNLTDHDHCQWFGLSEIDFSQVAPLDHEAIRCLMKN